MKKFLVIALMLSMAVSANAAEFLIMSNDRGSHAKGDIIAAKPNGWNWARGERDTYVFFIIRVPEMDLAEAKNYTGMDIDKLPDEYKIDLTYDGMSEIPRDVVTGCVKTR